MNRGFPSADFVALPKNSRILRVGPPPRAFIEGFRRGLRELGYIEGQHFVIEYGLAQSAAQNPDIAAELVRRGVEHCCLWNAVGAAGQGRCG
jgi:hypothetical protein